MQRLRPVSDALVDQLRQAVRRHALVIWLDRHGHYADLAERLDDAGGEHGFEIVRFRGSFLQTMLALEDRVGGTELEPLVVYLPGFLTQQLRDTPLYEIAAMGSEFQRGLPKLVTSAAHGLVSPDEIAAWLSAEEPTLARADTWLRDRVTGDSDELAPLRAQRVEVLLETLVTHGDAGSSAAALRTHLAAELGLTDGWLQLMRPETPSCDDIATAAVGWALAVEYVHDLERLPKQALLAPLKRLPSEAVEACRRVARRLREHAGDTYAAIAAEVEAHLDVERRGQQPRDLGHVDTFRFEGEIILDAALEGIAGADHEQAQTWAAVRLRPDAFWVRRDPGRRATWRLVAAAARLCAAIEEAAHPPADASSLAEFVAWYERVGASVDRAHRELEQLRAVFLYPGADMPRYDRLRDQLDGLRSRYAEWANPILASWEAVCERVGFIPDAALQQRTLFDEVVRPLLADGERVAYFVVDALRYELAQPLFEALDAAPGTHATMSARLSGLPSTSAVGMNLLAPVWTGAPLVPVCTKGKITGFSRGQYQVRGPKDRQRAMHERVGGDKCPWWQLDDVLGRDVDSLRRGIAKAKLIVIHSKEIDKAGHAGAGYDAYERVIRKLQGAWRSLREAGVRRFVFTADHGFLLLDRRVGTAQPRGKKGEVPLRHVLVEAPTTHPDELCVSFSALGYDGPGYFVFPRGLAVFDPGERPTPFVHGGASLQERVIPVITARHRSAAGKVDDHYRVELRGGISRAGVHSLEARASRMAQQGLPFGGVRHIELEVEAVAGGEVSVALLSVREGDATLRDGRVHAPVDSWFTLDFALRGTSTRHVQVRLVHRLGRARVEPATTQARFAVTSSLDEVAEATVVAEAGSDRAWLDAFEDPGVRKVFELLAEHGTIDETGLIEVLGTPRRARRFALKVDEYQRLAPFSVQTEASGGTKRYIRQGG